MWKSAGQSTTKRVLPRRIQAVGVAFAVLAGIVGFVAQPAAAQSAPIRAAATVTSIMTRLHTSGPQILDTSNKPFRIKAANWFGMETSNCAPHGLWTIGLDSGMAQIAGFGFNAIRLPFSNECIEQTAPVQGLDFSKNPSLQNKTPLQVMDAVIASAKAHGLRIILDRHRPDSGSQSELWYTSAYPESTWIADWVMLAKRYANEPAVIGADLHNEPHGSACWGCGEATRDWAAAATRGGNAVLAADPHLLILVEGVENLSDGSSSWWGGGLNDAAAHPITLDVAHQLVYSAHDYPASVFPQTWFNAANYPANLPGVWDKHFGYLQKQNVAPVLLGEFGTKLETTSDKQWLTALVSYLNSTAMSFAYWSFNPNSGDTGGLVHDDWVTPQTAKLAALQPLLGTSPVGGTTAPMPTTTTNKPTTTRSTSNPSITAPSTTVPRSTVSTDTASTTTTAPSTTTAPGTATPSSTATVSSTSSSTGAGVAAAWKLDSAWDAGYVADFVVTAKSSAVTGWSISWADPNATSVVNSWGMTCVLESGRITCTGSDWAAAIAAGGSMSVGVQVAGNGTAPTNPAITTS